MQGRPSVTLAFAAIVGGCGGAPILSEYGALHGALGPEASYRRPGPHSGVDFGGSVGDPVLAAADGEVVRIISMIGACGNGVVLRHAAYHLHTVYCHLDSVVVSTGQRVRRGDPLGRMGESGDAQDCRRVRPCPHVHFELTTFSHGNPVAIEGVTFDPSPRFAGCFEPGRQYPADSLVLTYPVRCRN